MAYTTVVLSDKSFRIIIPEGVRIAEDLKIGDVIQVKITKIIPKGKGVPQQVEKLKRPVGRPRKHSDKPCGTCGHYEDIHAVDEFRNWTGKCGVIGCDCQAFDSQKKGDATASHTFGEADTSSRR